ncbi:DUF1878 family protein [Metabacillus sp. KIGAM252]|uniref:DUF1878 family protein n=1 Tax=Metabacillus flavus TaxID=2823519 RepID=A0ABS5LCW5_9BACI|nr:DUF1878 family protein [Metabacillus flavus]
MDSFEERLNRMEFQIRLLASLITKDEHPYMYMIIEKQLSEKEHQQVMELCGRLEQLHQKQKAQGFVHFEGLLTLFVQELNENLEVKETAQALFKQGLFPQLMSDFLVMLDDY